MQVVGSAQSVQTALEHVLKDEACYQVSGGGVTLSGGEPLLQAAFSVEFLQKCKDHGIHTAVETTGHVHPDAIFAAAPYVDQFLFDIKHLDTQKHLQTLGANNTLILKNLTWLMEYGANVVARLPMIPGFNTDDAYLCRLKAFCENTGFREIHILPYHIYGEGKYHALGKPYLMQEQPMCESEVLRIREKLLSNHYQIKIRG